MASFFNDVEVLWISRVDYKLNDNLSYHKHDDFYQLIYCIDGACTVEIDDVQRNIVSPVILFIPPGVDHGISDISAGGLKTLDTKFLISSDDLSSNCLNIPYVIKSVTKSVYALLTDIHRNGSARGTFYREYCDLLIGQILIKLIRRFSYNKEDIQHVTYLFQDRDLSQISTLIISIVKELYQSRITTAVFEDRVNYSYRYLSKKFHSETNMTPIEYVEYYRISKAKELLSFSDYTIKYISEYVGFMNVHQFSRSFGKVTNIPPGQWRKRAIYGIGKDVSIQPSFININQIMKL